MTPEEAREILEKCHLLRRDIDRLCIKAMKALRPRLKIVNGDSRQGD
jgi:hypothetical protein